MGKISDNEKGTSYFTFILRIYSYLCLLFSLALLHGVLGICWYTSLLPSAAAIISSCEACLVLFTLLFSCCLYASASFDVSISYLLFAVLNFFCHHNISALLAFTGLSSVDGGCGCLHGQPLPLLPDDLPAGVGDLPECN